jgi:Aldo/keto reductase family
VTMQQRRLGSTGVWVSELCLGTMMFGEWGTNDHDQSIRIIHRALDAGITFAGTADVYSAGESEVIVGKALAGRRDDIVLATKAFMPMSDNLNHRGSSRRWIIREVEDSLRRLGTDWIDLYQIHRWDPQTGRDETLGALSDLVHQGKIRYFGHSTFPPGHRRGPVDRAAPQPRALRHRAADLLDPHPRHRERRPPHLPALRHGRAVLQPPGRRVAFGPLPPGRHPGTHIGRPPEPGQPVRPRPAREPAQARRSRPARPARRRRQPQPHRARDRLRPAPPRHHLGHHRPPDHGTPRITAHRYRRAPHRRRPRPHRPDRRPRPHPQPRRQRLGQPPPSARPPAAADGQGPRIHSVDCPRTRASHTHGSAAGARSCRDEVRRSDRTSCWRETQSGMGRQRM